MDMMLVPWPGRPTEAQMLEAALDRFGWAASHYSLSARARSDLAVKPSNKAGKLPPRVRMSMGRPVLTSMYVVEPSTWATMACCLSEKRTAVPLLRVGSMRSCR